MLTKRREGSRSWHNPKFDKDDRPRPQHPVSVYNLRNLRSWAGTANLTISFNERGYGQRGGSFRDFGLQPLQRSGNTTSAIPAFYNESGIAAHSPFSIDYAQKWLKTCVEHHGRRRETLSEGPSQRHTRLLQIDKPKLRRNSTVTSATSGANTDAGLWQQKNPSTNVGPLVVTLDGTGFPISREIIERAKSLPGHKLDMEQNRSAPVWMKDKVPQALSVMFDGDGIPNNQIHALLVIADPREDQFPHVAFMLLCPTHDVEGHSYRIGVLTASLEDLEIEGRDYTAVGKLKNEPWLEYESRDATGQSTFVVV
ncbi:hypothetical protein MKZ38_007719 [Zalerion maritima]|uniref:Uncharacterized protein n=1 Tax=Zalerion maritima TaxID=339359 RepID=A0AAD5RHG4_9PEZI|nr:hypothetical protein MKZ38_007719 [Zalerion maritima]